MQKVEFTRLFKHCVAGAIHPTTFEPGPAEVDEETAEIAIRNGYARPVAKKAGAKKAGAKKAAAKNAPAEKEPEGNAEGGQS